MKQIVIDTNVVIAGLRSKRGAAHRLLRQIGTKRFQISLSVSLFLEYEEVCNRQLEQLGVSAIELDDILDFLCRSSNQCEIFYLWRPLLRDAKDDMVLELAVAAECDVIVTYNKRDFDQAIQFGIRLQTPQEFLSELERRA